MNLRRNMNRLAIGVFSAVACALVPSSSAHAATVYVLIQGTVEYNQFVSGTFAGVPAGAPVVMRIKLDSTQFLNDPNGLPTRGYRFDYTKFAMTAGGVTAYLTPSVTTAYFVLRNNDPHVDGMFISTGTANDVELPLQSQQRIIPRPVWRDRRKLCVPIRTHRAGRCWRFALTVHRVSP